MFSALLLFALVQGLKLDQNKDNDKLLKFNKWATRESKAYKSALDHDKRFKEFSKKEDQYNLINATPTNTFTVGHNKFSDLTEDEIAKFLIVAPQSLPKISLAQTEQMTIDGSEFGVGMANYIHDWRRTGAVNKIQDQALCGSCWAFGVTAAQESANFLQNAWMGLQKFSEQMIIDCNKLGYACEGGWPDKLMTDWLILDQVKLVKATDYPYKGLKNPTCDLEVPR